MAEPPEYGLAWCAGFFEGEGTVSLTVRKKDDSKWFAAQVTQVYREPLDKFCETVGVGVVYGPYGPYQPNRQPYYVYNAYGKDGLALVNMLRPWLFRKGEQVDKAIADFEEYQNGRA